MDLSALEHRFRDLCSRAQYEFSVIPAIASSISVFMSQIADEFHRMEDARITEFLNGEMAHYKVLNLAIGRNEDYSVPAGPDAECHQFFENYGYALKLTKLRRKLVGLEFNDRVELVLNNEFGPPVWEVKTTIGFDGTYELRQACNSLIENISVGRAHSSTGAGSYFIPRRVMAYLVRAAVEANMEIIPRPTIAYSSDVREKVAKRVRELTTVDGKYQYATFDRAKLIHQRVERDLPESLGFGTVRLYPNMGRDWFDPSEAGHHIWEINPFYTNIQTLDKSELDVLIWHHIATNWIEGMVDEYVDIIAKARIIPKEEVEAKNEDS